MLMMENMEYAFKSFRRHVSASYTVIDSLQKYSHPLKFVFVRT